MKDAYKILGVAKSANAEQIKSAYRKAARERHPDLDPGNPWAEDDFKELTAAYEVLSNAEQLVAGCRGAAQAVAAVGAGAAAAAAVEELLQHECAPPLVARRREEVGKV